MIKKAVYPSAECRAPSALTFGASSFPWKFFFTFFWKKFWKLKNQYNPFLKNVYMPEYWGHHIKNKLIINWNKDEWQTKQNVMVKIIIVKTNIKNFLVARKKKRRYKSTRADLKFIFKSRSEYCDFLFLSLVTFFLSGYYSRSIR